MAVKEEGEAAIEGLDQKEIDGRSINVKLGTSKPTGQKPFKRDNRRNE